MSQICLADVPRHPYTECDPCIESYLTHSETTYPIIGGQTWACTSRANTAGAPATLGLLSAGMSIRLRCYQAKRWN
jgi:hypothetical protein